MTWIDFKLKVRKYNILLKTYFLNVFRKVLNDPITIFVSVVAIILAIQANHISDAAYTLAKNDTAQQAQINELKALEDKQRIQNDLSQKQYDLLIKQNEKLIQIAKSSKTQDSLSNELLSKVGKELAQQEYDVKIRGDIERREVRTLYTQINSDANYFIKNYDSVDFVRKLPVQKQLQIFNDLNNLINQGLKNSYIISHEAQYNFWYIFFEQNTNTQRNYLDTLNKNPEEIIAMRISLMKWYERWFDNFYENGVWPLVVEKSWEKEDWKRFEKTHYGSPLPKDSSIH